MSKNNTTNKVTKTNFEPVLYLNLPGCLVASTGRNNGLIGQLSNLQKKQEHKKNYKKRMKI